MRIAISGASGFLGSELIPILEQKNFDLLLLGRKTDKLKKQYKHHEVMSYKQWDNFKGNIDLFINLTTENNQSSADLEQFNSVNIELMMKLAERAARIGTKRFINFSTFQALDNFNNTPYAISKRQAAEALKLNHAHFATTIYVPYIYGVRWSGKLTFLNNLPTSMSLPSFYVFKSLKPAVSVNKIFAFLLMNEISGPEQLLSDNMENNNCYTSIKRMIDIILALTLLFAFWWLFIITAIVIKIDSKGPVIFTQARVGRNKVIFNCYKFRTMHQNAPERATHDSDLKLVTRLGGVLRQTKVDELPQLFNVLKNNMSFVGPRPCLPSQAQLISERSKFGVFNIKPGISGWAQINQIDMEDPVKLAKKDHEYCHMRSTLIDAKILILTFLGNGQGDKTNKKYGSS